MDKLIHRLGVKICRFANGDCKCANKTRLCDIVTKEANQFINLVQDSLNHKEELLITPERHQSCFRKSFDVV